jgi:hypothetical protein
MIPPLSSRPLGWPFLESSVLLLGATFTYRF